MIAGSRLNTSPSIVATVLTAGQFKEDLLVDMGVRMTGGVGIFMNKASVPGEMLQLLHELYKYMGSWDLVLHLLLFIYSVFIAPLLGLSFNFLCNHLGFLFSSFI